MLRYVLFVGCRHDLFLRNLLMTTVLVSEESRMVVVMG